MACASCGQKFRPTPTPIPKPQGQVATPQQPVPVPPPATPQGYQITPPKAGG